MDFNAASALVSRSVAEISLGIVVPLAVAALLTAYALYAGREKLVAFLLALYPTAVLVQVFPYWHVMPAKDIRFWIFLLLAIGLSLGLQKFVQGPFYGGKMKRIAEASLLAVLSTVLFFALARYLYGDTMPIPITIPFMGEPLGLFAALATPLAAIVLMARRHTF